jgi:tetratricopeptide (TPR) repeat protein
MMKCGNMRVLVAGIAATMVLAAASAFTAGGAAAQSLSCTKEPSTSASKALSPKIQTTVIEVQELIEAAQYTQALSKLQGVGSFQEMKPYDQSVLNQLFAQIYLDQNQYEKGVGYLEGVIRTGCGQLALEQMKQMIFNVGQIYIAIGAEKDGTTAQNFFKKGIQVLENWFRDNPYAMLAIAYLQIDPPDYPNGIKWLEKAISKSKDLGEVPKEGWYRNLGQLYLEIDQPAKALPIMELLVREYAKRDYWLQLAFVYGEMGRESDQFTTLEAANHQGLLTKGQEQFYLAQLYISNGMPIRAADIVESGIKAGVIEKKADHYRFLADASYTAKELDRAIKYYKVAGDMGDTADPLFFLGQIYMQKEDWQNAIDAFESAVKKNNAAPRGKRMEAIGTAHFNLGIAYYSLDKTSEAKGAFERAKGYKTLESPAKQWLNRINSDRK